MDKSVPKSTDEHEEKFSQIQYGEKEEKNNLCQDAPQKAIQDCNSHLCTNPSQDNRDSVDHNSFFWKQFGEYYREESHEDFSMKNWKDRSSNNSYTQGSTTGISGESHSCVNSEDDSVHNLSHVNLAGEAQMVDVSGKGTSIRRAVARAEVSLGSKAFGLVKENKMKKGDVFGVARVAGIMAAKRTWELIPLCHTLPLDHVDISLELLEKTENGQDCHLVLIKAQAVSSGRTGVEMEALTAATVAALTVYDMCKAVTHDINISGICLVSKTGGKRNFFKMPS